MRVLFIVVPASVAAMLAAVIHPVFGFAVGAAVAGLGIQVTEPRADRGEK